MESKLKKPIFCPKCHKRIALPIISGEIKTENGIKVECPYCKNRLTIK